MPVSLWGEFLQYLALIVLVARGDVMEIQSGVEMSGRKESKWSAGKPSLKELNQNAVRQVWTTQNGLKAQIAETLEVFGVESVLKKGGRVSIW